MAVQAQYPSNILLFNRSVQEEKPELGRDYSLQPHPSGGGIPTAFLDHQSQNHILFNNFPLGNCGANPRKRGREIQMNRFMSPLNQQQAHSNQFLDVAQLHSRNLDVSTGLGLTFNDQHQQQKHSLSTQSSDLSTLINQQREEIEHYLQSQGEELRRIIAEKRQRRYCALLGAAEESAARMLREKEAEAETATRRNSELEARVAQLSAEARAWETRARAQEAVAAALQAQLQEAVGLRCEAEDAESAYVDSERVVVASGPGCKACGKRVASVVLLPCRHLCVCSECDGIVSACPLCLSFRSSSIEVHMS